MILAGILDMKVYLKICKGSRERCEGLETHFLGVVGN